MRTASRLLAAGPFTVTAFETRSDAVVLTVHGEVDLFTAPLLRERLRERIRQAGPGLVVDLTAVRFFGVAGITVLLDVRGVALSANVGFRVVASTRTVLMPLQVTGVAGDFDLFPDIASALAQPGSVHPVVPAQQIRSSA